MQGNRMSKLKNNVCPLFKRLKQQSITRGGRRLQTRPESFDSFESQESHQLNEAGVSSRLNDPEGYCHWFRRSEKKNDKKATGFLRTP